MTTTFRTDRSNPEAQAESAAQVYRDRLAQRWSDRDAIRAGICRALLSRPWRAPIDCGALRHAINVTAVSLGSESDYHAFRLGLEAYRRRAAELRGERERQQARERAAQQQVAP